MLTNRLRCERCVVMGQHDPMAEDPMAAWSA